MDPTIMVIHITIMVHLIIVDHNNNQDIKINKTDSEINLVLSMIKTKSDITLKFQKCLKN